MSQSVSGSDLRPRGVKQRPWYRSLHRAFDHPIVFNLYQAVVDGGKGRQIRRFLGDVSYESTLDVGCGTGNWATVAPGRYLGVDVAEEFIAAAAARFAADPRKEFRRIDLTTESLNEPFDLVQMISVLHHLSDDHVQRILDHLSGRMRYLFILDLYPVRWNPVSRLLYALDRGDHVRSPLEQKRLIASRAGMRLLKEDDYYCPNGLYRHTLLLFETGVSPYSASRPPRR